MSPLPVRVEMKASCLPSGENKGLASFAECDTSREATPPAAGTVQISPPETNAISLRSGESDGSVKTAAAQACAPRRGLKRQTIRQRIGLVCKKTCRASIEPRRNLCVPLRLCGEFGRRAFYRRGAEERRDTQRKTFKSSRKHLTGTYVVRYN